MSHFLSRTAALTAALALVPASAALAADYAETARNIIPSGQLGSVPVPAGADEQARMYDALTPLFDQVTAPDLLRTFKSSKFGVDDAGPARAEPVPRKGVTITRDRFNVPHIVGKTRDDVTWAMGWTLAQDRALLLRQGRYPGRLAAIDAPNINAFGLVTQLKEYTPTKQVEQIVLRNGLRALRSRGRTGRALLHDVDVYVDGVNAQFRAAKSTEKPFTRTDIFAVNALVGQIFGQGGGNEPANADLLASLTKRLGSAKADSLFDDLSQQNDPDSPATLTKSFPYEPVPDTRAGNGLLDAGSYKAVGPAKARAAAATAGQTQHRWASNFLMVGANRSTTGDPLFVAGPQVGYFYPGLTLEADIKGPGFEARGATAPGFPGNILIGRGPDFSWSLTSAGSDNIDHYVETLCGGSSTRYRYKGRCRKMGRVDAGPIKGDGRVVYSTTVHGPVTGYATVGGKRVAVSRKRSSFGQDILFQLPFRDATLNTIKDSKSFAKSFAASPFTFNVAYADDKDIAMYSAGRLPIRDERVDPRLPTKGTGEYEWKGFISTKAHAQQVNPPTGKLVNWNNRPAPRWGSADDNFSYGSVYRSRMLEEGIAKRDKHDLPSVVATMNAAATTDLRNLVLTPTIAQLLKDTAAPSPRAARMLTLIQEWGLTGSTRLDRDEDGVMDAGPAPAIWDALYPRLVDAVLQPVLGPQLQDLPRNVSTDSDFTGPTISYLDKDLRTLAGTKFGRPFENRFCGGGNVDACRTALWAAIETAGNDLAAKQGADPDAWKGDANAERITFAPGVLSTKIRYTNRPSGIQQVMSFGGHRPRG